MHYSNHKLIILASALKILIIVLLFPNYVTANSSNILIPIEGTHYSKIKPMDNSNKNSVLEYYDYNCPHCANMDEYLQTEDAKKITKQWDFKQVHTPNNSTWNVYAGFYKLELQDSIGKEYLNLLHNSNYYKEQVRAYMTAKGFDWNSYEKVFDKNDEKSFLATKGINFDALLLEREASIAKEFVTKKGLNWKKFQQAQFNKDILTKKLFLAQATIDNPTKFLPMFIVSGKYQVLDNWKYQEIIEYLIKYQP